MHTCSLRPFPMVLSQGEPVLFLVPFLPALGTVSKGASVFLLNEASYSFLAGRDNGPHMVVLKRLTKSRGSVRGHGKAPSSAATPSNQPIKRSSSRSFVRAFSLSLSFAGPFCPPIGGPGASVSTPSALFTPSTKCDQQVFQICDECTSFCQCECD